LFGGFGMSLFKKVSGGPCSHISSLHHNGRSPRDVVRRDHIFTHALGLKVLRKVNEEK
jgi:hypothetical protein